MYNLLSANFYRLGKNRGMFLALAATAAHAIAISLVCWDQRSTGNYSMEYILTAGFHLWGYFPFPAFILAPLLSFCVGTENSEHTIRNKLVTGHTKINVYLAALFTCILTALALDILYLALAGTLCLWPVRQMSGGILLRVPLQKMLVWIAIVLLARAAYAAVLLLAALLAGRRSNAVLTALLLVVLSMFLCRFGFHELQYLESCAEQNTPAVYGPVRLAFWQLLMDVLPTGQYFQVSQLKTPRLWRMPLCSLAVIAVSSGAGMLLFQRKDLK